MPANVVVPESIATDRRMSLAERDHIFEESEYIGVRIQSAPVQPDNLSVLVVGIVVAALSVHELVAGDQHRYPGGEHQHAAKILNLPLTQGDHFRWHIRVTFPSAIPAGLYAVSVRDQIV